MEHFDIAVIGAGLAGLHCARQLADRGLRTLLVDRKRSLTQGIHTTGIFVRRTLESFSLPEDCLGPGVRHVSLYSPNRRPLHLESPRTEFRVGRMSALYERLLKDCCRSGVRVSLDTHYHGLRELADNTILSLKSRAVQWSIATRFLIGADGACSHVAGDLGLSRNRTWIVGVEDVLENVPLTGPPRFHCFLDPQLAPGYIAWVVQDGIETHIGVGGYPSRFHPLQALAKFRASLDGLIDDRRARLVQRRGGRIPVGGILPHLANRRGLLVGDAAGAVSPLTAGGLDPCLRLSDLAINVAARYLIDRDEAALAQYHGDRFRKKFRVRQAMRQILSITQNQWLLEFLCCLSRQPLIRPLAARVFFGRGSFPDVEPVANPRGLKEGIANRAILRHDGNMSSH